MAPSHFNSIMLLAFASVASAAIITSQPRLRATSHSSNATTAMNYTDLSKLVDNMDRILGLNETEARRQIIVDRSIWEKPALRWTFEATIKSSDNSTMHVIADAELLGVSVKGVDTDDKTQDAALHTSGSKRSRDGSIFDVANNRHYSHQHFFGETVCYLFDLEKHSPDVNQSAADKRSEAEDRFKSVLGQAFGAPLELYETAKVYLGRKRVDASLCSLWRSQQLQHLQLESPETTMAQLPFEHQQTPSMLVALQKYEAGARGVDSKGNKTMGATFSSNATFCVTSSGEMLETSSESGLALEPQEGSDLSSLILWSSVQRTTAAYTHHVHGRKPTARHFNATHGVANGRCVDLTQGHVGASELNATINDASRLSRINEEAAGHWEAAPYDIWQDIKIKEVVPGLGTDIAPLRLPLRSSLKSHSSPLHSEAFGKIQKVSLPEKFDPRVQWPMCPSLGHVRNQGTCGSCWAFAAATVLADRFCIAAQGLSQHSTRSFVNFSLAPGYLVDCDGGNHGCQGGRLDDAWWFLVHRGVPEEKCRPYKYCPVPSEKQCMGVAGFPSLLATAPADSTNRTCHGACHSYTLLKHPKTTAPMQYFHASMAYAVSPPGDVEAMQRELYTHGPMEVAFFVFSDFTSYQSGVYFRTPGAYGPLGGHAVRLLGWGASSMEYWLAANSWSPHWGLGGNFKIRRGTNECGIESTPAAGLPQLSAK